jgi:hypothetical protein
MYVQRPRRQGETLVPVDAPELSLLRQCATWLLASARRKLNVPVSPSEGLSRYVGIQKGVDDGEIGRVRNLGRWGRFYAKKPKASGKSDERVDRPPMLPFAALTQLYLPTL